MKKKKKKKNTNTSTNKKTFPVAVVLILAIIIVYFPAFKNGILNWDDNVYVTGNYFITSLSNIPDFFSSFYFSNYHPLTILTYSAIYHFGKAAPFLYHFTNIIFHVLNSLLVFYFIKELFKNKNLALIAALLFGLHPIHVESVAWISELKDVQYTFFFLISLIYYLKFIRVKKYPLYFISFLFFVLSLLSKGQAVALFPVLFLIDYFERKKIFTKLYEKIPFLILSVVFGIIAIMAQKSGHALSDFTFISPFEQLAIACYGFTMYILKIIFPFNLSAFYPYPPLINGRIPAEYWLSLLIIPATIYALIISYKKDKIIFFGLMFFISNIFLLLQLIPVGNCIMADRYSYIPSVGLNILFAYLFLKYFNSSKQKFLLVSMLSVYVIFLCIYTNNQTKKWKNDFTLWDNVLASNPDIPSALILRGCAYNDKGEYDKALTDFDKSISLNSKDGLAYFNRGVSKAKLGDFKNAIEDFKIAEKIKLEKRYLADFYVAYGVAIANTGDYDKAMNYFNKAIKANPYNASIYNNRGITNAIQGKLDDALNDFNYALKLKPGDKDAITNRNKILEMKIKQ